MFQGRVEGGANGEQANFRALMRATAEAGTETSSGNKLIDIGIIIDAVQLLDTNDLVAFYKRLLKAKSGLVVYINEGSDPQLWTMLALIGSVETERPLEQIGIGQKLAESKPRTFRLPNDAAGWSTAMIAQIISQMDADKEISPQLDSAKREEAERNKEKKAIKRVAEEQRTEAARLAAAQLADKTDALATDEMSALSAVPN